MRESPSLLEIIERDAYQWWKDYSRKAHHAVWMKTEHKCIKSLLDTKTCSEIDTQD